MIFHTILAIQSLVIDDIPAPEDNVLLYDDGGEVFYDDGTNVFYED